LFVITNCRNNESIVCCCLQIVSFPVGSLFYKRPLLSDQNVILSCNPYVMSCLYGVHYKTAQLHTQSTSAQVHAQSPSALQTNMATYGLQDMIQFRLN